jgi:two-component system LytT family response regulator
MRAVDRAVASCARGPAPAEQLAAFLEHLRARRRYSERIAVRGEGRVRLVELAAVDWIEAANKQVRLRAGAQVHAVRATMRALEEELDPAVFVRIHRSTIVNAGRVRELQPWFQGTHVLILHDGTRLFSGPGYEENVARILSSALLG